MHYTISQDVKPQGCVVCFKFLPFFIFLHFSSLLLIAFLLLSQKGKGTDAAIPTLLQIDGCTRYFLKSLPFPSHCFLSLSFAHLCLSQRPTAVSDRHSGLSYFHDRAVNQQRQLKLYLDIYLYTATFNVFPKGQLNHKVMGHLKIYLYVH